MRQPYTPIFRDLLDSSLWASASPSTRCVWITFLLDADPEGCIPTSVPGLARRANVPLEEAREAIALLEAPDPDSRTPDFEGRRVEKVAGGWRVLNFIAKRELAKREAEKARKRRWANENGKRPPVANDNDEGMRLGLDATSETLDAPKPKPKPKPHFSEEVKEDQAPPPPPPVASQHGVLKELPDDYVPSEALRMAATLAGVKRLDHWIAQLKMKPIGGKSGIRADKLDEWLIGLVAEWRKWEETDKFKDANSRSAAASGRSFQSPGAPVAGPARERVQGAPDWVYVEHAKFARQHAIDLARAAKAYHRQAQVKPGGMKAADVYQPFMKFLENLAAQRASA
jgi:hypothetical protein